jgi:hypothetical protein
MCRADGTCGLRPSCVRRSLLCILKFFHRGTNSFSAALDTSSIDTAAISLKALDRVLKSLAIDSSAPICHYKRELVKWRLNVEAGRTGCRPRYDIRSGMQTLRAGVRGYTLALRGAQTTGKSPLILMIK